MEPRPISRPPVDPASRRAFGRPSGVTGAFLAEDQIRDQGEFTPTNQAPDPVLAEAFGRPGGARDSLQRHPADAGALDAERAGDSGQPADPWRDPAAVPSLGAPPYAPPPPMVSNAPVGKLGVRDVLFGRRVSPVALVILTLIALVIGTLGGVVGRKTAEVV